MSPTEEIIMRDARAMRALAAAAAAFKRAREKGWVELLDDGRLFAIECDVPPAPSNPDQLSLC
jgi:hypothetical protein